MKQKESPTRLEPMQSIISFDEVQGKDMNIIYDSLSNRQKKVFDLLCTRKQSVTDITIALGYGDPRSYIRDIREKGIVVNDQWIEKPDIRYKVYWKRTKRKRAQGHFNRCTICHNNAQG